MIATPGEMGRPFMQNFVPWSIPSLRTVLPVALLLSFLARLLTHEDVCRDVALRVREEVVPQATDLAREIEDALLVQVRCEVLLRDRELKEIF